MNTCEDEDCTPICEKCGAPITTSAMAMICPRKEQCELYPSDEESRKFIREFCERGT
jgi:hypothetical protein